ncbi:MAG: hypothetical protein ABMB14_10060 [Myxococcota bacterium]
MNRTTMRALIHGLTALFASGCDEARAPEAVGADGAARDDGSLALVYTCLDPDVAGCPVVSVTLASADGDSDGTGASWWIDGVEQPAGDGIAVEVGEREVTIEVATADGLGAQAVLASVAGDVGDDGAFGDPYVVILGHQGSCALFRITTVGGCFTGPEIRFVAKKLPSGTPLSSVRFATNPPALVAAGYAWAAKWSTGSWTANGGMPSDWSGGFDHWFTVASGQQQQTDVYHVTNGVLGAPYRMRTASCVGGTPSIVSSE